MSTIRSKDNITDCYTIGYEIYKDMIYGPCDSLNADYAPNNVAIPSGQLSSFWHDWGNDIFDDWGYFYIFNPATNEYYFPYLIPENLRNGLYITNKYQAFGKTFTIKHGYAVEGIFKFDISCDDPEFQFIFGAYGDMGSDEDSENTNLTQSYNLDGNNYTLYYNRNVESGDSTERFFSYFIPYQLSANNSKTYNDFLSNDDKLSLYSVPVYQGITVYFSKKNDVYQWIINDLYVNRPRTQTETFVLSFDNCLVYDSYRFYQRKAVQNGFVRLRYSDYLKYVPN